MLLIVLEELLPALQSRRPLCEDLSAVDDDAHAEKVLERADQNTWSCRGKVVECAQLIHKKVNLGDEQP